MQVKTEKMTNQKNERNEPDATEVATGDKVTHDIPVAVEQSEPEVATGDKVPPTQTDLQSKGTKKRSNIWLHFTSDKEKKLRLVIIASKYMFMIVKIMGQVACGTMLISVQKIHL